LISSGQGSAGDRRRCPGSDQQPTVTRVVHDEDDLRALLQLDASHRGDRGAGRFLRDLWRDGQKYTADELVKFMGYVELDPSLMLAEIVEALAR